MAGCTYGSSQNAPEMYKAHIIMHVMSLKCKGRPVQWACQMQYTFVRQVACQLGTAYDNPVFDCLTGYMTPSELVRTLGNSATRPARFSST